MIWYFHAENIPFQRIVFAGRPLEVYQYLEPLYNDYRKVRVRGEDGRFRLSHVDEIIDDMLRRDHLFDIALPRIPARITLERLGTLQPRKSGEELSALRGCEAFRAISRLAPRLRRDAIHASA